MRKIPTVATVFTATFLALLGLLNIAATTAFNAILSLAVVGIYLSYLLPVVLMLRVRIKNPERIRYGPWKLGRWGVPLNVIAISYTSFTSAIMVFPPYQPVTASNMNYASVVLGGVVVLGICYWFLKGRERFAGPSYVIDGTAVEVARVDNAEIGKDG